MEHLNHYIINVINSYILLKLKHKLNQHIKCIMVDKLVMQDNHLLIIYIIHLNIILGIMDQHI